ncbi:MAG TPA: hypothetical protein VNF47_07710 [Streptosporangiaceae bacterium]|nr:hypothetical protein [Streptosporangiaceae bacterium]
MAVPVGAGQVGALGEQAGRGVDPACGGGLVGGVPVLAGDLGNGVGGAGGDGEDCGDVGGGGCEVGGVTRLGGVGAGGGAGAGEAAEP